MFEELLKSKEFQFQPAVLRYRVDTYDKVLVLLVQDTRFQQRFFENDFFGSLQF